MWKNAELQRQHKFSLIYIKIKKNHCWTYDNEYIHSSNIYVVKSKWFG